MKQLISSFTIAACLLGPSAGMVFAGNPHTSGSTGQPSQQCGVTTGPATPGNSVSAPGSAFNPNGTSGGVYAGNQAVNSNNPKSVAQYDVACLQVNQIP
jgi:hypothetical protein